MELSDPFQDNRSKNEIEQEEKHLKWISFSNIPIALLIAARLMDSNTFKNGLKKRRQRYLDHLQTPMTLDTTILSFFKMFIS